MEKQRSTKRQRELLNFVDNFIQGHGYGPSYREIMRSLGYKSVSTVAVHINGLIAKGYLRKRDQSARSLEVITTHLDNSTTHKSPTSTQEKWLIDIVSEKFNELETVSDKDKILDELYVLIGTLKILGLDDAHLAMKARLLSYVKANRQNK